MAGIIDSKTKNLKPIDPLQPMAGQKANANDTDPTLAVATSDTAPTPPNPSAPAPVTEPLPSAPTGGQNVETAAPVTEIGRAHV